MHAVETRASAKVSKGLVPFLVICCFVTGFVVNDSEVLGRPVGVTVAHDRALLVSEDGNGTIWRVTH